jgi:hypothetical protein
VITKVVKGNVIVISVGVIGIVVAPATLIINVFKVSCGIIIGPYSTGVTIVAIIVAICVIYVIGMCGVVPKIGPSCITIRVIIVGIVRIIAPGIGVDISTVPELCCATTISEVVCIITSSISYCVVTMYATSSIRMTIVVSGLTIWL